MTLTVNPTTPQAPTAPTTAFKANAMDKISQEQLNTPGMYYQPDSYGPPMYEERRRGSFLGSLVKTIIGVGVLAGAIVGTKKLLMNDFKQIEKPTSFTEKFKNVFAKVADFIEDYTWKPIKKLFDKKEEAAATKNDAAQVTPKDGQAPNTNQATPNAQANNAPAPAAQTPTPATNPAPTPNAQTPAPTPQAPAPVAQNSTPPATPAA